MNKERWSVDATRQWSEQVGWRVGCNFSPSTAGNQLEMWQAATFDIGTIEKELTWAAAMGMNTVRVYLHDLLFAEAPTDFLSRVEMVFAVAASKNIGVVPVLFDGVWNPKPKLGRQPEPKPFLHNSTWVQSPGSDVFYDRSRWSELQQYVVELLSFFKSDDRVIAWDLFNEPDQVDVVTLQLGSRNEKIATATELVGTVFDWAREVGVNQPLTVGVWEYEKNGEIAKNSLNQLIIDRSDIISFHCYEPREKLNAVIKALASHGRPLLCTEWLARSVGSTVDLLSVFKEAGVGAINWGLVDGRTQTRFPWRSWTEQIDANEPWFHDLLHADGSAYDETEVETFRRLTKAPHPAKSDHR